MKKIKSGVSFFRKQMDYCGKSEHNGRGVYEMQMLGNDGQPIAKDVVVSRFRAVMKKLNDRGMIDIFDAGPDHLAYAIKDEFMEAERNGFFSRVSYSTFCLHLPTGHVATLC